MTVSHLRSSLKSNYKNENCKKKHHPGFSRMPWLCQVSSASAFIYTCHTGTFISGVSLVWRWVGGGQAGWDLGSGHIAQWPFRVTPGVFEAPQGPEPVCFAQVNHRRPLPHWFIALLNWLLFSWFCIFVFVKNMKYRLLVMEYSRKWKKFWWQSSFCEPASMWGQ